MNYQESIEEFNKQDDNGKVRQVYAHFGLAVYHAQILEQQSINMIAACKQVTSNFTKQDQVDSLWEDYEMGERPFGKLISEMKTLYEMTEEDVVELSLLLKLRNYIAHDYFIFNIELFYSDSGISLPAILRTPYNFREFYEE